MKFTIIYKFEGKQYKTEMYGSTKEKAKEIFLMWHTGCEIVSVEK